MPGISSTIRARRGAPPRVRGCGGWKRRSSTRGVVDNGISSVQREAYAASGLFVTSTVRWRAARTARLSHVAANGGSTASSVSRGGRMDADSIIPARHRMRTPSDAERQCECEKPGVHTEESSSGGRGRKATSAGCPRSRRQASRHPPGRASGFQQRAALQACSRGAERSTDRGSPL